MNDSGRVYLVGAGPGAPDLITLRGAEVMRHANVVIYDYLASPEILRIAPGEAELIYAGKMGRGTQQFDQTAINQIMIEHARAGKRVVRLKGGDPFIFGRGGEEAEALAAAQIPFEIVPGISSAIAVPAYAGIPLTHRDYGSFVTFVTGHQGADKDSDTIPWDELAHASSGRGTIVILMATARMHENLARLISGGLAPDTPAAVIQWGTTAAQRTVVAPLRSLADEASRVGIGAPAIVVVGECVRFGAKLNWAEALPLFGRRIIVTRAAPASAAFAMRLRQLGAEAIEFPTIQTVPPDSYQPLDEAIGRIQTFDWMIFTSATGVDAFFERLRVLGTDIRGSRARIAAIGPVTAARLQHYALMVAATPDEYRAEALIDAIGTSLIKGKRFLIPRAQTAREILPEMLLQHGAAEVVVAPAYQTVIPAAGDLERIRQLISAGAIDLATFTSSSTVTNFCTMVGTNVESVKAAVIGPITAETARANGFEIAVTTTQYTVDGLCSAILEYFCSMRQID